MNAETQDSEEAHDAEENAAKDSEYNIPCFQAVVDWSGVVGKLLHSSCSASSGSFQGYATCMA